jgi:hypothetical protein
MIRKKPAPHLLWRGYRFSGEIMLKQETYYAMPIHLDAIAQ